VVPWTALDLGVLLLIYWFSLALASSLLLQFGFYRWYYGPSVVSLVTEGETERAAGQAAAAVAAGLAPWGAALQQAAAAAAEELASPFARQMAVQRFGLWAMALAFPCQIFLILHYLARRHGVRPGELGLTTHRLGRNLLWGLLAWAALTPLVYGVNQLFQWLFRLWPGGVGQGHVLTLLARQGLSPAERGLWLVGVLVCAPIMEEVLFRGLLQPWMAKHSWGGWLGLAGAFALSVWRQRDPLAEALADPAALPAALLPPLCVLALAGVMVLVQRRSRSPEGPAVFGAAVLFGFVHADWPSPLALLVLGVGLGVLAQRRRSLAGPILLHALFNAVTAVQLMGPW
jgi:membrane protease YdiL (CAAX protease family)